MRHLNIYAQGHGHAVASVRFGVGVLLLALGAYACVRGVWWGALFLVSAALHFYLGYRALHPPHEP
jgi:hypothetical protein